MGRFCCIPGCSKRLECDRDVSFHRLPLHYKKLLKVWVHKIDRKNLSVKNSTRVCSRHFVGSKDRKFCPDEYTALNLPILPIQVAQPRRRKSPKKRVDRFAANDDHHKCSSPFNDNEECSEGNDSVKTKDASKQVKKQRHLSRDVNC